MHGTRRSAHPAATRLIARGSRPLFIVGLVFSALAALLVPLSIAAATLPEGFRETAVISGLTRPTAVRFAANGNVFVAEKSGIIKVYDNLADTSPTVFADLRTDVHNYWDRGLLGLAIDPQYPARPFVYALYTRDAEIGGVAPRWGTANATTDVCPNPPGDTINGCVVSGRLARLTALNGVMSGAPTVLIDDFCQQYPSHSTGDVVFGSDGALYASAGDGASFGFIDYGQRGQPLNPCGDPPTAAGTALSPPTAEGGALRSQDVRTLTDATGLDGTLLRVDPNTGAGLADNPLAGDASPNVRRIVAYGMRNPFRLAARPGSNEVWAGDVGYGTWEELNRVADPTAATPTNFGWPCYEGTARQGGYDGANLNLCESLYGQSGAVTAPHYTYRHADKVVPNETCGTGDSSTAGLAFYDAGTYPVQYAGALFFADYSRDCIWSMLRGGDGQPDPATRATFVAAAADPVDLEIGPGGDLYYVDHLGGRVVRVEYFSANQPPVAVAAADRTNGPAPLTVQFSSSGSRDPEGGALSYAWDLDGDGAFDDATAAQPSFTYGAPGNYSARLRVTDVGGASNDSLPILITSNDTPPTATINAPTASLAWKVGDTINFSGSGSDAQQGNLPASALNWTLLLHHCSTPTSCHVHPIRDFEGVASGSFSAPDHEFPSHIELRLTATDASGLRGEQSVRIDPRTVELTLQTQPAGLQLALNGTSTLAPFTRSVISGSNNSLIAPSPQTIDTTTYTFGSWSDGGAATHDIIAGQSNVTYAASFNGTAPVVKALRFNGANSLVRINDAAGLRLTGTLTAEAWARPKAAINNHQHVFGKNFWELSFEPGAGGPRAQFEFRVNGTWHTVSSGPLALDKWYHLAGTYDGNTMRLFVDGAAVAAKAVGGNIDQSGSALFIGSADGAGDIFNGIVDEVRLSNTVRYSGAFTRPQGPWTPDAATVGLWHLNEGGGSTTADASGNGYTGTLVAAPAWADDSPFRQPDTTPPTITAITASGIGSAGATIGWTTGEPATSQVQYGTSTGYGSQSALSSNLVTSHSVQLSGLQPNTLYHYRVLSRDADGNQAQSGDGTFTTTAAAPAITNVAAGNVAPTSAGIAWLTDLPSDSQVEYGPTIAYGASSPLNSTPVTSHSVQLSGLLENTVYHFRVKSRGQNGLLSTSADFTFTTTSSSGTVRRSLQFNGTNSHVRVADNPSLRAAGAWTLEAWIKPTAAVAGHRHIAGKNNYEISVEPSGSGFRALAELRIGGTWFSAASPAYALNQWYHIAGTYDGSVLRIFVNGTLAGSQAATGNVDQTTNPFYIGSADGAGDIFNGSIDEVRLSSTARYTAGFSRPTAPWTPDAATRGLWHLDEGSGSTTADATGANNGTLTNGPAWKTDVPFAP